MSAEQLLNLPIEELEHIVRSRLNYLVQEGLVLQDGDMFRMKTQQELDSELDAILAE